MSSAKASSIKVIPNDLAGVLLGVSGSAPIDVGVDGGMLSAKDVKILQHLGAQPGYRAALRQVQPKLKMAHRVRICLRLFEQGWLDYSYRVTRFAIAPAGRLLLNLQTTSLPLTPLELWTLQACRAKGASPEGLAKVPETDRQRIIRQLVYRQLIKIKQHQVLDIWLTDYGLRCLLQEKGPRAVDRDHGRPITSAAELLSRLQGLSRQWQMPQQIPIFWLRDQLSLEADDFDHWLWQLWHQDHIELVQLQDIEPYSDSQVAAGLQPCTASKRWSVLPWFFMSLGLS
ncbi:MAG: hypothetical protein AAFU71_14090 [Cyanobacteria bacterium J06632_22]